MEDPILTDYGCCGRRDHVCWGTVGLDRVSVRVREIGRQCVLGVGWGAEANYHTRISCNRFPVELRYRALRVVL